MNSRHTGSCLCGKVNYTIEGSFEYFYLCHCSHCRKDSGSSHAANLFSSTAKLIWLSGQSSVTTFQLPGTRHARNFCATCGSALPLADAQIVVVPAGSLDSDIDLAPDGNIFTDSRATWDHELHTARNYGSSPTRSGT